MTSSQASFKELCIQTAKEFLQTVVVVDDQAAFVDEDKGTGAVLVPPTPGTLPAVDEPDGPDPMEPATRRALDAKPLIDAFAGEGLVCAILQPLASEQGENGVLTRRFAESTRRSDIVVLDWMLNDDDGRTALDLIEELVARDAQSQGRLRLIAVYTGEPDLDGIQASVKERILAADDDCSQPGSADVWIRHGPLRIVFYLKDGREPPPGQSGASVSVVDLPKRLIEQFAELTCGLVANVALASLAAVRTNAHHLLTKFAPDMDAPFLTHRATVHQHEDAEEFAVALVGHELQAVLNTAEVRTLANAERVQAWTAQQDASLQRHLSVDGADIPVGWDWVQSLLEKGKDAAGAPPPINPQQRVSERKYRTLKSFTRLFTDDGQQASASDHAFACLSSLARDRPLPLPMRVGPILTLGTILAGADEPESKSQDGREAATSSSDDATSSTYWLCVQPRCDSVRIVGWRKFLLAKLDAVTDTQTFDLVAVGLNGERLYMKLVYKVYEMDMPEFRAVTGGVVRIPLDEAGNLRPLTVRQGERFSWVAELRYAQAQHLMERFANTLSRVGFDEYEWLRRSARD